MADPPRLDLRTAGEVLRRSWWSVLVALPSLLLPALLLLCFRSALLAGTVRLSAVADRDPAVRSLLSRLSSSPFPSPPAAAAAGPHPQLLRRAPLLHLTRAGTLDDDFFSDPDFANGAAESNRRSLFLRSRPLANSSFLVVASDAGTKLLTSPKPYRIRIPPPHSSPFFVVLSEPDAAAAGNGKEQKDPPANLRIFARGIELNRQDAVAIIYLLSLLSAAHALAILGFVVTYSAALGMVFFVVASSYLRRPVSVVDTFSGTLLGIRRLSGFVFLRWAAKDALVQFLCLWFFSDIQDQAQLFKLFITVKLMPFSPSPVSPWPSVGPHNASLSGFFFMWGLLDSVVSVMFTVVPWVVAMDRNPRRPGRDTVKEGCYFVSLMPSQAVLIKCWETILCGSLGRTVMVMLGGRLVGGILYSIVEVYFMVAWLTFYLAARCKDAALVGQRFGVDDLKESIDSFR